MSLKYSQHDHACGWPCDPFISWTSSNGSTTTFEI